MTRFRGQSRQRRSEGEASGGEPGAIGELWRCHRCGRTFANRNQTHTCRHLVELNSHFVGKNVAVRSCFDAVQAATQRSGPFEVLPEKSRIAFHVRMSFAAFTARKSWLDGHVVLARELQSARFRSVQIFSPRNVLHTFRLYKPSEVDNEVQGWLAEAYLVGCQQHLR